MIEWEDSTQPHGQWQWLGNARMPAVVKCVSVGFLIRDTDQAKTLAPNLGNIDSPDNMQATGLITIPTRAVTKISPVRETRSSR
jgi:hypothetical protein